MAEPGRWPQLPSVATWLSPLPWAATTRKPGRPPPKRADLDAAIERVVSWLRRCPVSEVQRLEGAGCGGIPETAADAVGAVMGTAKRLTFQQTKAFKHRAQVEAIAAHCLRRLPPDCELLVEMGAGQAVLGQAVSLASGLPLIAIERRGNTDAFGAVDEGAPDGPPGATGEGYAPAARRVRADLADEDAWPESGQVALLAKHLCGHGSDLAIDAALRLGQRLSLLCLAPCCHFTMRWAQLCPESQQWLRRAGFDGGVQDFSLLLDVIRLARAGGAAATGVEGGRPAPCSRWRMRTYLAPGDVEVLGPKACRAIDQPRLARLRAAGLEVALVEYCDASLTPDNVLILAAPQGSGRLLATPSRAPSPSEGVASVRGLECGVLVEVDPTAPASRRQRLVSYLHEQRALRFPALHTVLPLADAWAARAPGLDCAASDPAAALRLLGQLMQCPLLRRAATRLVPFDREAPSIQAVADLACALLDAELGPQPATVRVLGRPRTVEGAVCRALGAERLSPTRFTHMLCVVPASGGAAAEDACCDLGGAADVEAKAGDQRWSSLEGGPWRFALVPRSEQDLSTWAAERQVEDASRAYWRSAEVAMRWPGRLKGVEAVALWTDDPDPVTWLAPWAEQFVAPGCPTLELRMVSAGATGQDDGKPPQVRVRTADSAAGALRAGLLLSHTGCGGEEAVDAVQALLAECTAGALPVLAEQGVAILRLRCGRKTRSLKRWHREMAQRLSAKVNARRVELLHLLSDKDAERTAVFAWDSRLQPASAGAGLTASARNPPIP